MVEIQSQRLDSLLPHEGWNRLWHGYIRCSCHAIRRIAGRCPSCNGELDLDIQTITLDSGQSIPLAPTLMGGEGRYEDWVFLLMIEREWKRSLEPSDYFPDIGESARPAPRAAIALIFWTYFETRIERLLRESMWRLPPPITDDLLARYQAVGSRVDRLYRVLFATTYFADLERLGYAAVADLLRETQEARNQFMHGSPAAITTDLISRIVFHLKAEHEAWIAIFNKRVSRSSPRPRSPE